VVPPAGLEPAVSAFEARCSAPTELRGCGWNRRESNPRGAACKAGRLPATRSRGGEVRTGRVELPRDCSHTGLSRACLPVPSTSASCRGVGRPGIEPGSPGLQPGAWTVLSYRSVERSGRDSNPRLRGCSPADAPLSYLTKAIPGEGFEPDSSLGSEPSVLPIRRSRSVETSSPRSRTLQLQFPFSRRRRASRAVSPARSPTAGPARSSPAPARLAALCESSPAAPGFTRMAHRGLEPRTSPTWEGLQRRRRIRVLRNVLGHVSSLLDDIYSNNRPHEGMQRHRCIRSVRDTSRFVAGIWLMVFHGEMKRAAHVGRPQSRSVIRAGCSSPSRGPPPAKAAPDRGAIGRLRALCTCRTSSVTQHTWFHREVQHVSQISFRV
jgi:hypothetical protein